MFRLLVQHAKTGRSTQHHHLSGLGLPAVDWLNSPLPAFILIVLTVTWRWTGYNAIIILAGLQNIPLELYEAAKIDGANPWQQFWGITLPLLRPIMLFALVLSVIGTLQLFTEPFLITGGGPGNATLTLGVLLVPAGLSFVQLRLRLVYRLRLSHLLAFTFIQFRLQLATTLTD